MYSKKDNMRAYELYSNALDIFKEIECELTTDYDRELLSIFVERCVSGMGRIEKKCSDVNKTIECVIKEYLLKNFGIIQDYITRPTFNDTSEALIMRKYRNEWYEVIDTRHKGGGHPDFIAKKDDKEYYIEVKYGEDGISIRQLEWMLSNADKNIIIYHVTG